MKKEASVVVFSGGCCAGKTSTLQCVSGILQANDVSVITLDELIRKKDFVSIDTIRENPSKYLELLDEIVRTKMLAEMMVFELRENAVVLIDRAITDSLFYVLFYLDKSKLTRDEIKLLNNLIADIRLHAAFAFKEIYDTFMFFKPITIGKLDTGKFRPVNIDILKHTESGIINMLNSFYVPSLKSGCTTVNLNKEKMLDVATNVAKCFIK